MKISCDIIKDLLPLYHDGVCSNDSKILIEEHINKCEVCKSELNEMDNILQMEIIENNISEADVVKKISNKWRRGMIKSLIKGVFLAIIVILIMLFVLYIFIDFRVVLKQ